MNITEFQDRDVTVVSVDGRIDGSTAPEVEARVLDRIGPAPALVLDLQHVDYVSSAGLRVVLKAAKAGRSTGTPFVLSGLSPQVREVFDISGFTSVLQIHPSSRDAVAAIIKGDGA